MNRSPQILSIALLFFFLMVGFGIAYQSFSLADDGVGLSSGAVPFFLATLLIFFGVIQVVQEFRAERDSVQQDSGQAVSWKAPMAALILTTTLVAVPYVGFYLATGLAIAALSFLLDNRGVVGLLLLPVAWMAFSYVVFGKILHVPLPVFSLGS